MWVFEGRWGTRESKTGHVPSIPVGSAEVSNHIQFTVVASNDVTSNSDLLQLLEVRCVHHHFELMGVIVLIAGIIL